MAVKKMMESRILGVPVAVTNMSAAVKFILDNLDALRGEYICLTNVHTIMTANQDPDYMRVQNESALNLPDGSPLAYVLKRRHFEDAERTAGPDLMPALWRATQDGSLSHFFYGSTPETIKGLEENLKKEYSGVSVAGMISPPFRELTPEEDLEMVERINSSGADILWVGLGAPKQEKWMNAHRGMIHAVMLGVGAGFDFHGGTAKRAPKFWQSHYMEWAYRLLQDPKRLWKRYVVYNFSFIIRSYNELFHRDRWEISTRKKLLIYAHYYYPDVASTGQLLTELAEYLREYFHITVICTVPSYTGHIDTYYRKHKYYHESIRGVDVVRIRVPEFRKNFFVSRYYNILSYFFSAMIATHRIGNQDIVFAISQPPILGGLLGWYGKKVKKASFLYDIQDFNPEQSMAVKLKGASSVNRLMLKADVFSCRTADRIVVVGRDQVDTLNSRMGGSCDKCVLINNWINEKEIRPLPADDPGVTEFREKYGLLNKKVIMYSGNLGLYYDLQGLIKVMGEFKDREDLIFAFVGEGTVLDKLEAHKESGKMDNVIFIPYQKKEKLVYSLNAADVHLVVNAAGIKGVSVPSKLYGVMACAKPVIGVLEKGAEADLIIRESGCGLVSEPGDYGAFRNSVASFLERMDSDPTFPEMGKAGRRYLDEHMTMERSMKKYRDILKEL